MTEGLAKRVANVKAGRDGQDQEIEKHQKWRRGLEV